MVLRTLHSNLRIRQLIRSSLPVQNKRVKSLLKECLETSGIVKNITVLSSAYIKSPISIGLFHPRIILPIPVISDFDEQEIRYILLHELQHFKHKDLPVNYAMCLAGILYWFHPLVCLGLKEMRNDRELACDASVLNLLEEDRYFDYGNALILFAGKLSNPSFPFAAGIGGTTKQITKRIQNIAAFSPESGWLKFKSKLIFAITFVIILTSIPFLSVNAASDNRYLFTGSKVDYEDLSPYFEGNEGSFVLYNQTAGSWSIYNKSNSIKRISPDSTYKIYSALFGLESGSITPKSSIMPWNKINNPYTAWNRDQNLDSAMENSVNWYFQALDQKTGKKALKKFIKLTGYGNEDLSGGLSHYWMESSLKISPVEQVELLTKFYQNDFHFKDSSIKAVKHSLLLNKNNDGSLYGKTGSGRIEEKDINGWFIGFVEKSDTTYFFAANIQAKDKVNGSLARNIALNILKEKNIFTAN
jgi:bla regulator protein BlaR1